MFHPLDVMGTESRERPGRCSCVGHRGAEGLLWGCACSPRMDTGLWGVPCEGGAAPQLVFVTPEPVMGHCWCLPAGGSPMGLVGGTGGASEDLAEWGEGEEVCWQAAISTRLGGFMVF